MELAYHQILGLVLLYFLIGFVLSIRVIREVGKEREKDFLRTNKLPSDNLIRTLTITLWPIVVLMSMFKKKKIIK